MFSKSVEFIFLIVCFGIIVKIYMALNCSQISFSALDMKITMTAQCIRMEK